MLVFLSSVDIEFSSIAITKERVSPGLFCYCRSFDEKPSKLLHAHMCLSPKVSLSTSQLAAVLSDQHVTMTGQPSVMTVTQAAR